jgi:hypothetical protein
LTERDSHRFRSWCFLIQNVYRRSLSSGPDFRKPKVLTPLVSMIETRKDSAVHVSLSSSSLVKQPGSGEDPLPRARKPFSKTHSTANHNRLVSVVDALIKMRSFKERESSPWLRARKETAAKHFPVAGRSRPRQACLSRVRGLPGTFSLSYA